MLWVWLLVVVGFLAWYLLRGGRSAAPAPSVSLGRSAAALAKDDTQSSEALAPAAEDLRRRRAALLDRVAQTPVESPVESSAASLSLDASRSRVPRMAPRVSPVEESLEESSDAPAPMSLDMSRRRVSKLASKAIPVDETPAAESSEESSSSDAPAPMSLDLSRRRVPKLASKASPVVDDAPAEEKESSDVAAKPPAPSSPLDAAVSGIPRLSLKPARSLMTLTTKPLALPSASSPLAQARQPGTAAAAAAAGGGVLLGMLFYLCHTITTMAISHTLLRGFPRRGAARYFYASQPIALYGCCEECIALPSECFERVSRLWQGACGPGLHAN